MGKAWVRAASLERDWRATERDHFRSETPRGHDADLLAEDGADGDLEGIPSTGRAQAGLAAHRGGKGAVAREVLGDGLSIGVEIEDTAETRGDDGQRRNVIAGDLCLKRIALGVMADGDEGDVIVHTNDAAIDAIANLLHTRNGTRSQEGEQRAPVEWRPIGETQNQWSGGGCGDGAAAQLAGWALVEGEEGVIEAADAAEARRHRDRSHGQAGFMQKLLGEEHAARLRDGQGRCADVLIEKAAELALAHAERVGELLDRCAGTVECALGDAGHGAADGACCAAPCRGLRRNLRPAAKAGAKAGLLCRRGAREEAAVVAHRRARRADGSAVDAGGSNGGEEVTIEARIAGLKGAIANVGIQQNGIGPDGSWGSGMGEYGVHHLFSVLRVVHYVWPFSDVMEERGPSANRHVRCGNSVVATPFEVGAQVFRSRA